MPAEPVGVAEPVLPDPRQQSLAAGVAHVVNNVLTAVAMRADMIRADAGTGGRRPGQIGADARAILDAVARGSALTQSLLQFAGRSGGPARPVDLARLVAELPELAAPSGDAVLGGVRVTVDIEPVPPVWADPDQLARAVAHLVANALTSVAGRDRCEVQVAVRPVGEAVELAIEDTGPGMDPSALEHAGQPFAEGPDGSGAGLGLAAAAGVIAAVGGQLYIGSGPRGGTTVRARLPAGQPAVGRRRVLVVDDGAQLREGYVRVLAAAGFDAIAVDSAQQALQLLDADPGIGAVVSDVRMPGMSGTELAARVLAGHHRVGVLLVTGIVPHPGEVPEDPRIAVLAKPTSGPNLVAALSGLLDRA